MTGSQGKALDREATFIFYNDSFRQSVRTGGLGEQAWRKEAGCPVKGLLQESRGERTAIAMTPVKVLTLASLQ